MNCEHRIDQVRPYGRRPPPTTWDRWAQDGAGARVAPAPIDVALNMTRRGATEPVGRSRTAPPRYRSLLVPVDGSPFGEHALPLALGIARRAGAALRVVHVYRPMESVLQRERLLHTNGLDAWLRRRQQAYLDHLIRRIARVTSLPVTPAFIEGREIAATLCEVASAGTDLIVMATHGHGPLERIWRGSVADVLMRRLSVPLLLVRGYNAPVDLTGDPLLRHILIPLDGSDFAEQVLEPAVALGALTHADHTLLRVIPLETDDFVGYGESIMQRPHGERRQAEAWSYLRRAADRLGGPTRRVHPCVVLDEQPVAKAILHYAQAQDADLIALATRGRGGLSRLFGGSVADRVVRSASMPVLVFRPDTE
ncbi:MAG: universal stress protein [Isosphaeraceae bacterium]|nr:universal stress protein [Isosphaeraceae bacterium]